MINVCDRLVFCVVSAVAGLAGPAATFTFTATPKTLYASVKAIEHSFLPEQTAG